MKTPRSHVLEVLDDGGIDEEMECCSRSRRVAKLALKRFHPLPAIHKGIMLTFIFMSRTARLLADNQTYPMTPSTPYLSLRPCNLGKIPRRSIHARKSRGSI